MIGYPKSNDRLQTLLGATFAAKLINIQNTHEMQLKLFKLIQPVKCELCDIPVICAFVNDQTTRIHRPCDTQGSVK
jgi:hypothetical protein